MSPILLGVALIFLILIVLEKHRKNQRRPPGPIGLPFIGSILSLGSRPYKTYKKWAQKYGKIYEISFGQDRMVVISDYAMVKEAFQHPLLSGRKQTDFFQIFFDNKGVIATQEKEWEEQRRFMLRNLRDFGFGKNLMESYISEEVGEFINWLVQVEGKPVSLNTKFNLSVVNSLWRITAGERYDLNDPRLQALVEKGVPKVEGPMFAVNFFLPWLAKLVPRLTGWDKVVDMGKSHRDFYWEVVKAHQKNLSEEPRDFIDVYLKQIAKSKTDQSSFSGEYGLQSCVSAVGDIFQAGTSTTSTALTWAVLYLMTHPKVQRQVQAEIEAHVGKSRRPCLADRAQMPYCEATILEVLRFSAFVPAGVYHSALEDVEFRNYLIPKGTLVMANQYYIQHDPEVWGDPENFRPERWLSEDGQTLNKNENLIIFSVGKRLCVGMNLAKDSIFLFLTSIFQKFEALPVPGEKYTLEPVCRLELLEPRNFNIILREREGLAL